MSEVYYKDSYEFEEDTDSDNEASIDNQNALVTPKIPSQRLIDLVFSNNGRNEYKADSNIIALYVNWEQWAEHNGRSPLHGAAEANLCWEELKPILQRDKAAILAVDPKTNMEAFMLAAVGSDSKLESVYALLENHPAAVSPYVVRRNAYEISSSSNKRKALYL